MDHRTLAPLALALALLGTTGCSDDATSDASNPAGSAGPGAAPAQPGGGGRPGGRAKKPRAGKPMAAPQLPPIEQSPGYAEFERSKAGKRNAAMKAVEAAIELDPTRPEFRRRQGELHVMRGDMLSAKDAFQAGLELDPTDGQMWHNLGMANYELGQFEFAGMSFERAIQLMPDSVRSHYQLGRTNYRLATVVVGAQSIDRGRMNAAVKAFRRAIDIDPKTMEAHLWAGIALKLVNDYEGALNHLEEAMQLQPDHVEARIHAAEAALQANDPELSELYYTDALALDQECARAHVGIARLREFDGDFQAAAVSYELAASSDPEFPDSYYGLSQVYARLEQPEKAAQARAIFERLGSKAAEERNLELAQVTQQRATVFYEAGVSFQTQGDFEKAEQAFQQTLAVDPNHSEALTQLGKLLRKRGDLEQALEYLRRAELNDKGNLRARKLRISTEQLLTEQPADQGGSGT